MITKLKNIPGDSFRDKLESDLKDALKIQCSIAYMTDYPKGFLDKLQKDGSCAIFDFKNPTSLEKVKELDIGKASDNVYLHDYLMKCPKSISTPLVHSKIIILDYDDKRAKIWIGSHNWTVASLDGLNIETSVSIECMIGDTDYNEAQEVITEIKKISKQLSQFNQGDLEYLKAIHQGLYLLPLKSNLPLPGHIQCQTHKDLHGFVPKLNDLIFLLVEEDSGDRKIYGSKVTRISDLSDTYLDPNHEHTVTVELKSKQLWSILPSFIPHDPKNPGRVGQRTFTLKIDLESCDSIPVYLKKNINSAIRGQNYSTTSKSIVSNNSGNCKGQEGLLHGLKRLDGLINLSVDSLDKDKLLQLHGTLEDKLRNPFLKVKIPKSIFKKMAKSLKFPQDEKPKEDSDRDRSSDEKKDEVSE